MLTITLWFPRPCSFREVHGHSSKDDGFVLYSAEFANILLARGWSPQGHQWSKPRCFSLFCLHLSLCSVNPSKCRVWVILKQKYPSVPSHQHRESQGVIKTCWWVQNQEMVKVGGELWDHWLQALTPKIARIHSNPSKNWFRSKTSPRRFYCHVWKLLESVVSGWGWWWERGQSQPNTLRMENWVVKRAGFGDQKSWS